MHEFRHKIKRYEERCEVGLSCKVNAWELDSNEEVARGRLAWPARRLFKNPVELRMYDTAIRDYIQYGFAENMVEPEISRPLYFMPYQALIKEERETTKFHTVFDASPGAMGKPSLNDTLLYGLNLNLKVLDIFLCFRMHVVVRISNIKRRFCKFPSWKRIAMQFVSCRARQHTQLELMRHLLKSGG